MTFASQELSALPFTPPPDEAATDDGDPIADLLDHLSAALDSADAVRAAICDGDEATQRSVARVAAALDSEQTSSGADRRAARAAAFPARRGRGAGGRPRVVGPRGAPRRGPFFARAARAQAAPERRGRDRPGHGQRALQLRRPRGLIAPGAAGARGRRRAGLGAAPRAAGDGLGGGGARRVGVGGGARLRAVRAHAVVGPREARGGRLRAPRAALRAHPRPRRRVPQRARRGRRVGRDAPAG